MEGRFNTLPKNHKIRTTSFMDGPITSEMQMAKFLGFQMSY